MLPRKWAGDERGWHVDSTLWRQERLQLFDEQSPSGHASHQTAYIDWGRVPVNIPRSERRVQDLRCSRKREREILRGRNTERKRERRKAHGSLCTGRVTECK